MKQYFSFAGVKIAVDMPQERCPEDWKQLGKFTSAPLKDPHVFSFQMMEKTAGPLGEPVEGQMQLWRCDNGTTIHYAGDVSKPYLRGEHNGKKHSVQLRMADFPGTVGYKTVLNAMPIERLTVEAGSVILHCAYIDIGGKAVLFTAPSGVGKSTQAELWKQLRGAEIINGDRAAMGSFGRNAVAMGIPFCGSSSYCENRTLPICAIVSLSQASETKIRRLKGFEAFRYVWEGCSVNSWDREDMDRASAIVGEILKQVPVFRLDCTPDESAVIALERAMQEV